MVSRALADNERPAVIITGGAGFIGSHLAELLKERFRVFVVDNLSTGSAANVSEGIRLIRMDIRDAGLPRHFARIRPQLVYHLAAQCDVGRSLADPGFDADVNIRGSLNVLAACRAGGAGKLIFASTSAVYGDPGACAADEEQPANPISGYGLSKWTAEQYIRLHARYRGLRYTICRFANVYGPRQKPHGEGGVVAQFVERLAAGLPLRIFGDGEQTRDFIFVRDVVTALAAAAHAADGEVLNIGSGRRTSVNALADTLAVIRGGPLARLYEPPRAGDIRASCLDNRKACRLLAWRPRCTLARGLAETIAAAGA